jgi:hypothetical protein
VIADEHTTIGEPPDPTTPLGDPRAATGGHELMRSTVGITPASRINPPSKANFVLHVVKVSSIKKKHLPNSVVTR